MKTLFSSENKWVRCEDEGSRRRGGKLPSPGQSEQALGGGCSACSLVRWFGSGSLGQPFHLPTLAARLGDPEWVGPGLAVPAGPGDGVGYLRAHLSLPAVEVRPGSSSRRVRPGLFVSLSGWGTGPASEKAGAWVGLLQLPYLGFLLLHLQKDGQPVWALGTVTLVRVPPTISQRAGRAHIRGRWKGQGVERCHLTWQRL